MYELIGIESIQMSDASDSDDQRAEAEPNHSDPIRKSKMRIGLNSYFESNWANPSRKLL